MSAPASDFEALLKGLAVLIYKARADMQEPDAQLLRDLLNYSTRYYGWRAALYGRPWPPAKAMARVVEFLKEEELKWSQPERLRIIAYLEHRISYKVEKGRPPNYKLLFLLRDLADKWVILTDMPFTQSWVNGAPVSLGAQFVEAVVRYLDPKSLPALPKMLERVVAERFTSGN